MMQVGFGWMTSKFLDGTSNFEIETQPRSEECHLLEAMSHNRSVLFLILQYRHAGQGLNK